MRVNVLRSVAVALGFTVCGVAQAQTSYVAPAQWNNFQPASMNVATALPMQESVPAPAAEMPEPITEGQVGDAYTEAAAGTWEGCSDGACGASARLPLKPCFGGLNLLYFGLESGSARTVAGGLNGFSSSAVDPENSVGFEITAGKYLKCGRFGLGLTYFNWNPGTESEIRTGGAGTIVSWMPSYNGITVDPDGAGALAAGNVFGIIDGTETGYAGATGVRLTRDVSFQGIEANLYCFGLMGARRASYANCCPPRHCLASKLGFGKHGCYGYGGAAGPLVRACNGRIRVMASHGFRWMQISDDLELAYNIDGTVGYQATDIYDRVDIENNLYGYQFGGQLNYCLSSRLSMNIGGKFGLYANHAQKQHRIGSETDLAYISGSPTDVISTTDSDTGLASIGEFDMGLGYRIGCAWTVRGGYRLIGITGVATAWDSLPNTYASVAESGAVHADDSYLLHGGYFGLEYNW